MSGQGTGRRRIAAVDVGTNTALLVIAECAGRTLEPILHEDRFVRLGEGVDASRRISAAALDRLVVALADFRRIADSLSVSEGIVGGTSASRDALNREELVRAAEKGCGWPYGVLSGWEEATLTFAGALSGVEDAQGTMTVVDVGGGSTEIVVGDAGPPARVTRARSADVGSVRVKERFFGALPPDPGSIDEARRYCREALAPAAAEVGRNESLVGAGGTATCLARLSGTLDQPLPVGKVEAWSRRLLTMTAEEVLALDPGLMRGRQDVFGAGVLTLAESMHAVGARTLYATDRGLRHGLALRAFGAL